MKNLFLTLVLNTILIANFYSQTITGHNKNLVINHGDITLYLDKDTSTMLSKHNLSYKNYKKLGFVDRCNCWYVDTFSRLKKSDYTKAYRKSGYDMGHLTPSYITTYDSLVNRNSFSFFNQAPQYSYFNQSSWKKLESQVEDIIDSLKSDAIIITGVIYNQNTKKYLATSRIKIPLYYFKVLYIKKQKWVWIAENSGDNKICTIKETTITGLNLFLTKNNMKIKIK